MHDARKANPTIGPHLHDDPLAVAAVVRLEVGGRRCLRTLLREVLDEQLRNLVLRPIPPDTDAAIQRARAGLHLHRAILRDRPSFTDPERPLQFRVVVVHELASRRRDG
eukprot:8072315-Alexandrium_andersonii.AAC.1